jgi:hypothetical protein
MDLETAKKLNEVLTPLGYTVGKVYLEMEQYKAALEIARTDLKYSNLTDDEYKQKMDKVKSLENEFQEIEWTGHREVPQSTFHYRDLLKKIGME